MRGRLHELTAGPAALGAEVAAALGVAAFTEELGHQGGTLLVGRARPYDRQTRLVEDLVLAVWRGRGHSLVTTFYGATTAQVLGVLRALRITEHADGIAVRPGRDAGFATPATLVKQVPGLGLLEVSPRTDRHPLPAWSGLAAAGGAEVFRDRLPDGRPVLRAGRRRPPGRRRCRWPTATRTGCRPSSVDCPCGRRRDRRGRRLRGRGHPARGRGRPPAGAGRWPRRCGRTACCRRRRWSRRRSRWPRPRSAVRPRSPCSADPGGGSRWPAAAVLLALLAGYAAWVVRRGRGGPCGCSRAALPMTGWVGVRAGALAALALAGAASARPDAATELPVVLLAAATLACLLWQLPAAMHDPATPGGAR